MIFNVNTYKKLIMKNINGIIIGASIIIATILYLYFSPYHSCKRSLEGSSQYTVEKYCRK